MNKQRHDHLVIEFFILASHNVITINCQLQEIFFDWVNYRLSTINNYFFIIDLEAKLQQAEGSRLKLIVTDGVFSMDGTPAPLAYVLQHGSAFSYEGGYYRTLDIINIIFNN